MKSIPTTPPRHLLRALSLLLRYPDAGLRGHLTGLAGVIAEDRHLPAARREELLALVTDLQRGDPYMNEARYIETFDRGRSASLHLFEHVHGDSRDRGQAMIDLLQTYETAGLLLGPDEMPDHLSVALEFASTQPAGVAQDFLGEFAHILTLVFSALLKRESIYASLIAAVLELSGQKVQAVPVPPDELVDDSWQEPEPFNGCSVEGQGRPSPGLSSTPQPLHFVEKSRMQQGASHPGARP